MRHRAGTDEAAWYQYETVARAYLVGEISRIAAANRAYSLPTVVDGVVYIVGTNKKMYALDAVSGTSPPADR